METEIKHFFLRSRVQYSDLDTLELLKACSQEKESMGSRMRLERS